MSIATAQGASRIVVTLSSASRIPARRKPKAVRVIATGRTYKLTRRSASAAVVSLGTWRSAAYSGEAGTRVRALAGAKVKVRVLAPAGTSTLSATVAPAATGPTAPALTPSQPVQPTPPSATDGPPFNPPGRDLSGNEAYERIKGYFANSRFTDCVAGWPNCAAYENRYSHFPDGTQYYCRLTPTSGSDIRSTGTIAQITGAEQKADGAWGVEYRLSSYDNVTFYSWSVGADGTTTGRYWGPGQDPTTGPPTEQITGMQWLRGALTCDY